MASLIIFKLKPSTLLRKFVSRDIVNIYAYIITIKYFYFFKNRLMIILPKITSFILLRSIRSFFSCDTLVVIVWKLRSVIYFMPRSYFLSFIVYKCSSLKPYTFLFSYLSLFFRKFYLLTIPYLALADIIIEKNL